MKEQEKINFSRIAEAIGYLKKNYATQPSLEEVAGKLHLSPFHFQRLFTEWAGVSPKKFLQYITIEHAKKMLRENQATLFDAAFATGLSGTSRLHDLFISIESMSPGEYKNGGTDLSIHYNFYISPFGNLMIASTPKGICQIVFADDENIALKELQEKFPYAKYSHTSNGMHQRVINFFSSNWNTWLSASKEGLKPFITHQVRAGLRPALLPCPQPEKIQLHLKGTEFQIKIWETLLKIPMGQLSTYGKIAKYIHHPNASRAVGTAIGKNPVAFLIPCHRVIQSTGVIGDYHWGSNRKAAMIGWEAAQVMGDQ